MFNNSAKYQVIKNSSIIYDDYITVSKYYQPIIGPVATLIYINFLNEVLAQSKGEINSISKLQVYINTSLDKIYYALKILIKADLVEMYKSNDDELYVFGIKSPLSAKEFLNDDNFSHLLYNQVGEKVYNDIESSVNADVFNFENFSKVDDTVENKKPVDPYFTYFSKLELDNDIVDIHRLCKVANLNKLSKIEIETILPLCKSYNEIDVVKFIKAISIIRDDVNEDIEKVETKEDALLVFDKYDSEMFLSKLSGGRELTFSEDKLIKSLRENYKLIDPVINVLIDYVLLINDKNLNKNFVEAIAANWSRKNLTTSVEAMEFVREFNKKKTQANNEIQGNIVPEWLNKEKQENLFDGAEDIEELDVEEISEEAFDIFSNFEGN